MSDHRVRELSQLRLTLRDDLEFTPRHEGGGSIYVIEDSVKSQFYQVGVAEYLLMSMFDGRTTVGQALTRLAAIDSNHTLTMAEATSICKWLVESDLASTPESSDRHQMTNAANDRRWRKRLGTLNPLCTKVPLAYPDRFFSQIAKVLGFLFGRTAAIVVMVLSMFAIYRVSIDWVGFTQSSAGISSPGRWAWFAACWLVLKVIHETGHAVVCRRYGGRVHEAGAMFVLFAPLAYVDLTSSWRFRSKWQRIHTAAAGMYIELGVAAFAAIGWSMTGPGMINDLCFNVVLMAGVTTILFNANPLMRFDGYYILSDFLEIPNLYGEGQQYLQYVGRRYILGERIVPSLSWSSRETFIRIYAVAAFLWRIIICCSLVLAASVMFHGAGILIATIAIVLWCGVPLYRLIRSVTHPDGLHRRRQFRLAAAVVLGTIGVLGTLSLSWPATTTAPVIVQYESLAHVRASSPGFVHELCVVRGQYVKTGQPIARLANPQLVAELRDLELAIEQSELKCRVFRQSDEVNACQAEQQQLHSLLEKRFEKQRQVDALTLTAGSSGRVIVRNLQVKMGDYLDVGDELVTIGDDTKKELHIAIQQSDHDRFRNNLGKEVFVRVTGGVVFSCLLNQVEPRATMKAPHESMYAAFGGPLVSHVAETRDGTHELLSAHFTGKMLLTDEQSRRVCEGQRGIVSLGASGKTVGERLREHIDAVLPKSLASLISAMR